MLTTVRRAFRMLDQDRRGRWWLLVLLASFVALLEMVGALLVFLLMEMVVSPMDEVSVPVLGDLTSIVSGLDEGQVLLTILAVMGVFFVFRAFVKVGSKYAQFRVACNAGARLSNRLAEGYLRMPYSVHIQRNSAELIRNTMSAVDTIVFGIYIPVVRVVAESLILLGILTVLLIVSPLGTLIAVLVVGGAATLLLLVVQPRVKRIGRQAHDLSGRTLRSVQQSLKGIRDVKILGREMYFAREFGRNRIAFARTMYLRSTIVAVPAIVIETALIGFILLFFGLVVVSGSEATGALAVLALFGYAGLRIQPSLQQIVSGLNEMKHATAPLDDLYEDLQAVGEGVDRSGDDVEPLPFARALTLKDVSFQYEEADRPALNDINLTIRPGEQIGICGPTGGGKTTLVDVITGLLEPSAGSITVDDKDLLNHEREWQRNLGVVPQMVFLIDDTLRRNIALGVTDDEIDEEALRDAVELAQLTEFVSTLPGGLDSMVGESGVRLSGGQRQRVAIARALYHRSSVLVFDEGTSALDTATELSLMDAIEGLRGDHTIILVAHRLTTVRKCDKVVFVENGRISGVDTFEMLEQRHEGFRRLVASS